MNERIVKKIWHLFLITCGLCAIALFITFAYKPAKNISPAYVNIFADPPPKFQLDKKEEEEIPPSLTYQTYLRKGDEFIKYGEYDQGIIQYLKANRLESKKTEPFLRIGDAYLKKGNSVLAKENYVRAMQIAPDKEKPRLTLAHYYIYERNFDAASKIFQTIDKNQEAAYYLGLIATLQNKHEEAKKNLEEAKKINPENKIGKKADEILKTYESFSLTRDGSDLYLDMLLAQIFNTHREFAFALEKALGVLRVKSDYRDAWLISGHTYLNLGKFREAHIALSRALSFDTEKPEILFLLGLAYQGMNDPKSAIENFISAFRKGYKNTTQLSERLAEAYSQAEDYENAIKHYEIVLLTAETDVGYYVRPVWIYIEKLKKPTKALELAMKAFQKFPNEAMSYNLIGWASLENGMLESAKKYLDEAIKLDPELDAAYLNIGYYYEIKQDLSKAKSFYKIAWQLAKENNAASIANLANERYENINIQ